MRTIVTDNPGVCLFVRRAGCAKRLTDRRPIWSEVFWEPRNTVLDGGSQLLPVYVVQNLTRQNTLEFRLEFGLVLG